MYRTKIGEQFVELLKFIIVHAKHLTNSRFQGEVKLELNGTEIASQNKVNTLYSRISTIIFRATGQRWF
jgi:hypothetical protein